MLKSVTHLSDTARRPLGQLRVSLVEDNAVLVLLMCQPRTQSVLIYTAEKEQYTWQQ